jgi:hypothetical protein
MDTFCTVELVHKCMKLVLLVVNQEMMGETAKLDVNEIAGL